MNYKGEDITLDIELKNDAGTLVDLDSYYDIVCAIYTRLKDSDSVVKFSKRTRTGYELLTRISSTKYQARVTSAQSATMDEGNLMAEGRFVQSSSDMPDGYADTEWKCKLGELTSHALKTL